MASQKMPCLHPEFRQSVPLGRWSRIPAPEFPAQYRYRNADTGETVLVPAIWYNGTAEARADYLCYCADRADALAERQASEGKPWSAQSAADTRKRAAWLRREAARYAAAGAMIASHVPEGSPAP